MKNLLLKQGSIFSYVLSVIGIVTMFGISANVHARAELALTQSVEGDVESVLSGQEFTFKLQYRCASITEDCRNVQLVSTLPVGIVDIIEGVLAPTNSNHIDTHSIVDNVVTWQFADPLPAGSTGELTLGVTLANGKTPDNTVVTNSATISSDNADSIEGVTSTVVVTATSTITLTKVLNVTDPRLDYETRYRITMCNQDGEGQLDLDNVTLVDQLVPNTGYIASGRSGVYNADADTITWPTKDLKVGECFTFYDVSVRYPSSDFVEGDITNVVTATGTLPGVADPQVYTAQLTNSFGPGIGDGIVDFSVIKLGPSTVIEKGSFDYGFTVKNIGSVDLIDMVITDTIPTQLVVTKIRVGNNNQAEGSTVVTVEYKSVEHSDWTLVVGSPFSTPGMKSVDVTALGLAADDYITDLKWTFPYLPVGFRSQETRDMSTGFKATVLSEDRNGAVVNVGDIIENTAHAEANSKTSDHTEETEVIYAMAKPLVVKTVSGASTVTPGDTTIY
ncbi:MAG: hypothetical protein KAG43_03005, partial [Candidatus Marithrix sp.]|nr:hypothetical protein [Candidatus Marithrix sp.]